MAAGEALQRISQREWQRADPDRWVVSRLGHPDPGVRARAALALGRMDYPAAFAPLTRALADRAAEVRRSAAFALRLHFLDTSTLPPPQRTRTALGRALRKEADDAVVATLLLTLGWIGNEQDYRHLTSRLLGQTGVAASIAWGLLARRQAVDVAEPRAHAAVVERNDALLLPLAAEDAALRQAAAWAAAQLPPNAISEALRRALRQASSDDPDEWVRSSGIRALGRPRNLRDVRWLSARSGIDPSPRVHLEAARALAAGSTAAGVKLAQSSASLWRRVSASHFRLIGPELHPVLFGLRALERHADVPSVRKVMGELLELTDVGDSTVRYTPEEKHSIDLVHCAAARVWDLGTGRPDRTPTCGTAHTPALDVSWRRRQVVDVIAAMPRAASWKLTLLRRYLQDPLTRVRAHATAALGLLDSAIVAPALTRALGDPAWDVVAAAAEAAALQAKHLQGGSFTTQLLRRFREIDSRLWPEPTCAAARALGALRARAAAPLLHRWARSSAWSVRQCALEAIVPVTGRPAQAPEATPAAMPGSDRDGEQARATRAVIVTDKGEVELQLLRQEAPLAVARFTNLAMQRRYRGARIERVAGNRLVEVGRVVGGDEAAPPPLPCELAPRAFVRGSVGFASKGRDTARTRFFIAVGRQPDLDGRRTQFARVRQGMDVVDQLEPGDRIKDLYIPKGGANDTRP